MAKKEPPKRIASDLVLGIVMGAAGAVAAALVVVFLLSRGHVPQNIDELDAAISNEEAINCSIAKDDIDVVIQTNIGWSKLYAKTADGEILAVKGDGLYMWTDDDGGYKVAYDSAMIDELTSDIGTSDDEDDSGYTLKCSAPSETNFAVPKNVEFIDMSDYSLDDLYDLLDEFSAEEGLEQDIEEELDI
jgi:hypothetical protein